MARIYKPKLKIMFFLIILLGNFGLAKSSQADTCSIGGLIFSWHMESDDLASGSPAGCSTRELRNPSYFNGMALSNDRATDGSKSLKKIANTNQYALIPVGFNKRAGSIKFDLWVSNSVQNENFLKAFYDDKNSISVSVGPYTNTINFWYEAKGEWKYDWENLSPNAWHSIELKWRTDGQSPSLVLTIDNTSYTASTDPLVEISGPLTKLQIGSGNLSAAEFYIDNLRIYDDNAYSPPITYYVDFNSGNNSNSGTSPSSPWNASPGDSVNCTAACAATSLNPGDKVIFRRSVTYRGTIEVNSRSGMSVAAGNKGSISRSGVLTDPDGPFAGVQPGDFVYLYHNVTRQENTYVERTGLYSVAAKNSNSSLSLSGFSGDPYSSGDMSYDVFRPIIFTSDNSWGSGDAVFDGENTRDWAFKIDKGRYVVLKDLTVQNYSHTSGNTWEGAIGPSSENTYFNNSIIIDGCKFISNNSNGAVLGDYSIIRNSSFDNTTGHDLNLGKYSLVENNHFQGAMRVAMGVDSFGIWRYNFLNSNVNNEYEGYHSDTLGAWGGGDYWWVYGNTFYLGAQQIYIYDQANYGVLHSNVFIGSYFSPGCVGNPGYSVQTGPGIGIKIYNNTWWGPPPCTAAIVCVDVASMAQNHEFKNNIFYSVGTNLVWLGDEFSASTNAWNTTIFDYNHYYSLVSTPFQLLTNPSSSDQLLTLNQWKARGYDSNGIHANNGLTLDPLFVNNTWANYDLHLQAASPDLSAAANLSSYFTKDRDGRKRPPSGPWSVGAYQTPDPSTPSAPTGLVVK